MKHIYYILIISYSLSSNMFTIVEEKSTIKWKGTKSTGSYHDGLISIQNGFITIDNNIIINGEINIDMNSITCTDIENLESNQYLISHLKNDDFFSVPDFPLSNLKIIKVDHQKNDNYLITADLTIKSHTHPIQFLANIKISENAAVAIGKIEIDRSKYNIKYKSKTWYPDIGDRFINDIFELYFNLVALPIS